jgi:para-nitrobenzyl esterase
MTGTGLSATSAALAFAASLALGSLASAEDGDEATAVVDTDAGPIRGTIRPTTITFRGIPYAEPPVGDLRWRPPEPRRGWRGVRDATQFGAHCPQPGSADQPNASEDCLFLNVYIPRERDFGGDDEERRRPVMVWIYGGANASGASDFYDPTPLVEIGGVVVVTVNYRIGALGFLAHPALDREGHLAVNYGVMDQQLALRWVRDNIESFGGDPANVTIFGESAGGLNVTTHLVSPRSAGLFHRAIIESGAYQLSTPSLAASEARGTAFANRIGCPDQSAACLRSKSLADVLANAGTVNTSGAAYNQSTVDGQILPETQISAIAAGRINRVPVMQGANSHEGRIFTSPTLTVAGYEASLAGFAAAFGRSLTEAFATYPLNNYPNPFEAISAALGDFAFACSAEKSNQFLSQYVPTYGYEFDDPAAGPLGATHGAEIVYLFNVNLGPTLSGGPGSLPPPSQLLSIVMRKYWSNFARSSNPNSVMVPRWESAPSVNIQLLVPPLPHVGSTAAYGARHHCAFWN